MKAYFAAQPWVGGRTAIDFLREAADEVPGGSLRIAVAWSNFRGLATLTDTFDTIRARGGRVDLITGLSSGGATQEGLKYALDVCDGVHVSFDFSGPTFHPKVYLYGADTERRLLVGSNNLTLGGLYRNTEAAVELRSETSDETEPFSSVGTWMDELIADTAFTLPLTAELLPRLIADPRLRIPPESQSIAEKKAAATGPLSDESPLESLFSKSARKRHYPKAKPSLPLLAVVATQLEALIELDENLVVLHTWSKRLSESDAQVVKEGRNPTNVLRLSKARWPIDHKTYFREIFFGDLDWADIGGNPPKESCVVPTRVVLDGADLGVHFVGVDYAPSRVADQNNVPTVLHWGPLMAPLRAVNHAESWVVMKAYSDGTFGLEVKASPDTDDLPPAS